jgi:hypothetical protein
MNANWSLTAKVAWFLANLAWNFFFGIMVVVAIEYTFGGGAEHEAAAIGLVDSGLDPFWGWTVLALGWMTGWIISTTCGWLEVFTSPVFIFGMWIESI